MNVYAITNEHEHIPLEGLVSSGALISSATLKTYPSEAAFEGALGAAKSTAEAAETAALPSIHTVQAGENLWRIVEERLKQAGGQPSGGAITDGVKQVARANGLKNPDLILVGQTIDLSSMQRSSGQVTKASEPVATPTAAPVTESPLAAQSALAAPSALVAQALPDAQASLMRGTADTQSWQPLIDFRAVGGPPHAVAAKSAPVSNKRADLSRLLQNILRPKASFESVQEPTSPWSRLLSKSAHLTSGYGMRKDPFTGRPQFHDGVDLAAPSGTRIHPYDSGTVVKSGWEAGYGKMVKVRHANGLESVYGHNLANLVRLGDQVTEKTTLGLVGSSGRSTGPHLHFEVRRNGSSVNPVPYLTGRYSR